MTDTFKRLRWLFTALMALVLWPTVVQANAGVPMLAVVWPLSWFAFIPIVAIEATVARTIVGLSWRKSLLATGAANLSSTLIGIPITWILLVFVEMIVTLGGQAFGLSNLSGKVLAVTIQAPWLVPYEADLYWMIPAAVIVLLPFFGLTSVLIERTTFRKVSGCDQANANRWSWKANCITYGLAIVGSMVWLTLALMRGVTK